MQSEQIHELATALAKAQISFQPVLKGQEAKGTAFSYHYADLATVLDAVRKPLSDNGLCLMHTTEWTEAGAFVLIGRLIHTSGQYISAAWPLPDNAGPQDLGKHLTYGRRYTATALLGIAAEEDDDAQGVKDKKVSTRAPRKPAQPEHPHPSPSVPKKKITLMRAQDGSVMEFDASKAGAIAAFQALDVLLEESENNWEANREVVMRLLTTAPDVSIGTMTVKEKVDELVTLHEGVVP